MLVKVMWTSEKTWIDKFENYHFGHSIDIQGKDKRSELLGGYCTSPRVRG